MKAKTGLTLANGVKALLVIAIFAVTIGAVVLISAKPHVIRSERFPRIDATCIGLQMGLTNYRAAEQRWPLPLVAEAGSNIIVIREDNARVFAPLFKNPKISYIDPSALLTKVPGKGVMRLQDAMKMKIAPEECPLGYLDPANKEVFKYFKVTFNLALDTVDVEQ
jgi:hypothetical protein